MDFVRWAAHCGGFSTILHKMIAKSLSVQPDKNPFLVSLGERTRSLRARRGMTRKAVAVAAGVSERHLANLEYGEGNASILVLVQVAGALGCSLAELLGDMTTQSADWLLLRSALEGKGEVSLQQVRSAVDDLLGARTSTAEGNRRIALIGLRGAGKSTLGQRLALDLGFPFVEITHAIEALAGCSASEIQALYGMSAYRRYERRALTEALDAHTEVVIATPGGIVSDAATFNQVLGQCTTVWLQATPEDHMKRVIAQGDTRPIAASKEAMEDLKGILAGRSAFYSKANLSLNTSAQPLEATFAELRDMVRAALGMVASKVESID